MAATMTLFKQLLAFALTLAVFAPFTTAFPSSREKRDDVGTVFVQTATLIYQPPFSFWTEFAGISKPAILTMAQTLVDGASSTLSAPLVSYSLPLSFPAKLLSFSTTVTLTSTVSLNTTTVTLDRFGHTETSNSTSSIPPQTVQPNPSQFVSKPTSTETRASGTVIFQPPLRLKTSKKLLGNVATSTMSPTPTELFILITNSATLITQTTVQSTIFVKESSRKGKNRIAPPTGTPDTSCSDKLQAVDQHLKSWKLAFAATGAILAVAIATLAARLVGLNGRFKKVEGFWATLHGLKGRKASTQVRPLPWRPALDPPPPPAAPPQRQRTTDWNLHGGDGFPNVELGRLR